MMHPAALQAAQMMGLPTTYTVFQLLPSGRQINKEHLNDLGEVNEWMDRVHGEYATIQIVSDRTGADRVFTDNGRKFELVQ